MIWKLYLFKDFEFKSNLVNVERNDVLGKKRILIKMEMMFYCIFLFFSVIYYFVIVCIIVLLFIIVV